ncbi:hypothetical protein [Mycobacterium noviomagense]|uniref:Uncharacterized protein n=1 Tax=Mycobacterium noviomagense TaxID=459858 RepID=A0A7I7P764_9MYCO|nr:hypothetical protein [Mycobacterium noviomagense]ORB10766.1 hypothetical protein BST37_22470 [Mycobacterium noviomagense]BBY04721.1 hypothetical protein MNVI_00390 [Mycobacterium noviomagense]
MKRKAEKAADNGEGQLAVNSRVRVYPGTDQEDRGIVVEDFGESAGQAVDVGKYHIADPARRWAVMLDGGNLVFVDSDQLVAE